MKPKDKSQHLLSITRAKAKMYEYSIPDESHIKIRRNPSNLFPLSIGLLGDVAADMCRLEPDQATLESNIKELRFSALFFDSYIQSKLNGQLDNYLSLLAASTYYLCDLPGSSTVILKKTSITENRNTFPGKERFLLCLLESRFDDDFDFEEMICRTEFQEIKDMTRNFFSGFGSIGDFQDCISRTRKLIYDIGTPRDLLLTDICFSVLKLKLSYSSRTLIPKYSAIEPILWNSVFAKENFIKELWPSQRILGEKGVFNGKPAIIQMPTSAGKSKSIEIIIRSAFMSKRAKTCVVVAPFRALCKEITETLEKAFSGENINVNELSDVFQNDFDADTLLNTNSLKILSLTPEKLVYILRQSPELAEQIGLLVFDEGHQFDNGIRGVTYELLISSLKSLLPQTVQTILISAVISNAEAIRKWLLGDNGVVIKDNKISPTFRTVGFATWKTPQGRIQYVNSEDITLEDFWVPRVIESQKLNLRPRESKERFYPKKTDGKTVAMHLGIKLIKNGSVAIFCGKKDIAKSLIDGVLEAVSRGYNTQSLLEYSDEKELFKISHLYEKNFGIESSECKGAKLGILAHHAGIPHGLRLSTEHALRVGKAKFIVCTSTLAQGVNLPLRYLIFTNIYQAGKRIKVRDFHNFIGRAGRSGFQTEGTILFSDSDVYDEKNYGREKWRFQSVRKLFDPNESEPCGSSLLSIFDPIYNQNKTKILPSNSILNILESYYKDETFLDTLFAHCAKQGFDKEQLSSQLKDKFKIAGAVESHLMDLLQGVEKSKRVARSTEIARGTLAYHFANPEEKDLLEKFFILICKNINKKVPSEEKQSRYGRTLLGLAEMIEMDNWIQKHLPEILGADNDEEILRRLFPVLEKHIDGKELKRLFPAKLRIDVVQMWIQGQSYFEIEKYLSTSGAIIKTKSTMKKIKLPYVASICNDELAFNGMLVLGAIGEILNEVEGVAGAAISSSIKSLQKRIKYGLKSDVVVRFFELGFSDRVIAHEIANYFTAKYGDTYSVSTPTIKDNFKDIQNILDKYPSYFTEILNKYQD